MPTILFLTTTTLALILMFCGGTVTNAQNANSSQNKDIAIKKNDTESVAKTTNVINQAKQKEETKKMSEQKDLPEYIGTGELQHDGTIILRLTREQAGIRFHDELHYVPKDPNYQTVLKHIGPVKENEIFSVKPFPDEGDK